MPDATTTPRPVHRAPVRCSASPPAWQQARHTGAPLDVGQPGTPSRCCTPPVWALGMAKDAACTRPEEYGLGRSPLVPWGEIPVDLRAQPPCTLGRNTCGP